MNQDAPHIYSLKTSRQDQLQSEDLDFAADCKAAFLEEKMPYTNLLLLALIGFLAAIIFWAARSNVSEIARAQGKVIPNGHTQIVQSFEGGILSDIFVREGDLVEKGQQIIQLDDTLFQSTYQESRVVRDHLLSKIARLDAEALQQDSIQFPDTLVKSRPDLVASEILLFETRRNQFHVSQSHLQESLELKRQELEITRPLAESGIVSQVELLRLKSMVNDLEGQIERERSDYFSEVVSLSNEYQSELNQIEQSLLAYEDKIARTSLKAPVTGIVNKIHIQTLGGVLQPGAPIVEIVPTGNHQLVQANVNPTDIAYIKPGLEATVRLSSYDFSIYGGLKGTVEKISADTFVDENGRSYYQVIVRAGERTLQTNDGPLMVIPGMVAQVDIQTGRKSVLDYLLKPLMRAKMNALTER